MLTQIIAGETLNYVTDPAEHPSYLPADGWELELKLNPRAGGSVITVAGTPEGDAFLVRATAATTAGWAPGWYGGELWFVRGGEAYRALAGQVQIVPGLRIAPAGTDTRSDAERALAAIEATLSGKAGSAVQSYQINGRSLSSYSLAELIKLRELYRREVASERRAAGLADGRGSVRRIAVRLR
jgi:hypothetical protein